MKKRNYRAYAIALYETLQGKSEAEQKKILHSFAGLLQRQHILQRANAIIEEFIRYAKKQSGSIDIAVRSARELPSSAKRELQKLFGAEAAIETNIVPELLGGIVVQTADTIFDASVSKQLELLHHHLTT